MKTDWVIDRVVGRWDGFISSQKGTNLVGNAWRQVRRRPPGVLTASSVTFAYGLLMAPFWPRLGWTHAPGFRLERGRCHKSYTLKCQLSFMSFVIVIVIMSFCCMVLSIKERRTLDLIDSVVVWRQPCLQMSAGVENEETGRRREECNRKYVGLCRCAKTRTHENM